MTPVGAIIIGVIAGIVPFLACTKLKQMLGYDDALDTFGVHAVGGTVGALVTGFLADAGMNPNLNTNLKDLVGNGLWLEQLKAMGLTIALAVVATVVIGYALKATIGLRPNEEDEELGARSRRPRRAGLHTSEHTYGHLEQEGPRHAGRGWLGRRRLDLIEGRPQR
ncbi:MAG: hypothetical protein WDO74_28380 [Pseudomonadota bacterium]